jgi:hypothetical protein
MGTNKAGVTAADQGNRLALGVLPIEVVDVR